jgi:hypothetical protein
VSVHQRYPTTRSTGHRWHDVLVARAALSRARDRESLRGQTRGAVELARSDLVVALTAYVDRLTAAATPVPYRIRDEIRLHAALVAAQRR